MDNAQKEGWLAFVDFCKSLAVEAGLDFEVKEHLLWVVKALSVGEKETILAQKAQKLGFSLEEMVILLTSRYESSLSGWLRVLLPSV